MLLAVGLVVLAEVPLIDLVLLLLDAIEEGAAVEETGC